MASYTRADYGELITRLIANYRATFVAYPGEPFSEPEPSAAGSTPTDWIAPRLIRSDSDNWNTEGAQQRAVRFGIWAAFQAGRGDLMDRIDAIAADLEDALGLARNTGGNSMLGTLDYVGTAAGPPYLETSNPWEWHAWFYDGEFLGVAA